LVETQNRVGVNRVIESRIARRQRGEPRFGGGQLGFPYRDFVRGFAGSLFILVFVGLFDSRAFRLIVLRRLVLRGGVSGAGLRRDQVGIGIKAFERRVDRRFAGLLEVFEQRREHLVRRNQIGILPECVAALF